MEYLFHVQIGGWRHVPTDPPPLDPRMIHTTKRITPHQLLQLPHDDGDCGGRSRFVRDDDDDGLERSEIMQRRSHGSPCPQSHDQRKFFLFQLYLLTSSAPPLFRQPATFVNWTTQGTREFFQMTIIDHCNNNID